MFLLCNNKRDLYADIKSYVDETQRNPDHRIDDANYYPDGMFDIDIQTIGLERRAM